MKSLTAVCQTGATMPTINPNGRAISRHQHPQRENAEMKMYLSKLKDLVPFMPKNRKLSKLEIIQHVIDYICDLQSELEAHPEMSNFDAASALNFVTASQNVASMAEGDDEDLDETEVHADEDDDDLNIADEDALTQRLSAEAAYQPQQRLHQQHQQQQQQSSPAIVRQPLADRQAPNTILPAIAPASHVAAVSQQQQHQHQQQQQQQPQLAQSAQQTTSAEKGSRQNVC